MKSKRQCLLFVSACFIFSGLVCVFIPDVLLRHIIQNNLVLSPNSQAFKSWEYVSPMPMDFYFFNWTNPQDIYNASVKPKFQQVGPYRFMMDLRRVNITWNDNGTVTYGQQKFWYFSEEGTVGSLQDVVTTLNTPALGAAHVARTWNFLVRRGLSFTLSGLSSKVYVTHTVDELLFTGYPDTLTKMGSSLPVFAGQDIPKWDRMGMFYKRNGSSAFEGIYNVGTGIKSVFGQLTSWNYKGQTPYYEGHCGKIEGSSGDKFDPTQDRIKMFLPDVCRSVELEYVGEIEVNGVIGKKYVMGDHVLDNGTMYPDNKCFCDGECIPSGVFNVTSCRFGSPAFLSLPHFYKADSYYSDLIEGVHPEQDDEFSIVLEPKTGIPLLANAKLQVNFMLHSIPSISVFEGVPKVFFPVMWFDQKASIPENDLQNLKLLLNVPTIMISLGLILVVVGMMIFLVLVLKKMKNKKTLPPTEEDVPLKAIPPQCDKFSKNYPK